VCTFAHVTLVAAIGENSLMMIAEIYYNVIGYLLNWPLPMLAPLALPYKCLSDTYWHTTCYPFLKVEHTTAP
jgi:hypothetical protein